MLSVSRLFFVCTLVAVTAVLIDISIRLGNFQHIYNHWPDNCTKYALNGSEDIAVFPDQRAVFSSGLYFPETEGIIDRPVPKMYMVDFNAMELGPTELVMDIERESFNPHGVGHWVTTNGDAIVYVINHRDNEDTIESFFFKPEEKRLKHRGSFGHPLFHNLNGIAAVGLDKFYVTVDHYFRHQIMKSLESFLLLPLSSVVYFDEATERAKVVAGGLTYANGIALSNNQRFLYVSNIGAREVSVYRRWKEDNSLEFTQTIKLRHTVDNIFIDPTNGHMWVATFPRPVNVLKYIHNRSVPVEGRVFHIRLYEEDEQPFSYETSEIEEVFESDGTRFGPVTVAVYSNNRLMMGTIASGLMICDNVRTSF